MYPTTAPIPASGRRTILASNFVFTLVIAAMLTFAFANTFASGEKGSRPVSATPIRSCIVQNPKAPVWVPHRQETAAKAL